MTMLMKGKRGYSMEGSKKTGNTFFFSNRSMVHSSRDRYNHTLWLWWRHKRDRDVTTVSSRMLYSRGWPNLLNVRVTYDKLQMFESRKTWTNITHTFLLLHAHLVTKNLKYIYSPLTLNLRFNPADSQFIPVNNYKAWTFFIYLLYEL
jgi:hypothetical protein